MKKTLVIFGISLIIIIAIGLSLGDSDTISNPDSEPSTESIQATKDLDDEAINYLDVCMNTVSISDLEKCGIELKKLNDKCLTNEPFSSMPFCNDQRINDFDESVDARIKALKDEVQEVVNELEKIVLNQIEVCMNIAPLTPLSPQFNSDDLDQCDIFMNTGIKEICIEQPSFEFCNDGKIGEYYELRSK